MNNVEIGYFVFWNSWF